MRPLYCDERVWVPVADGLRRRGWTVRLAREEGMLGASDRSQLALAEENSWILMTFDDDFLSLVRREGLAHTGIIFVQQAGRDIGDVVKLVDVHLAERSPGDNEVYFV